MAISPLERRIPKSNKAYPEQGDVETVSRHRALAIGGAISACVEAFKNNYADIMKGDFPIALIEASSSAKEFKEIKMSRRAGS